MEEDPFINEDESESESEKIFLQSIGERIRAVRKNKNLTIGELAGMVNLSDSFMGLIERGKGTRLFNVVNICDVLNIKINDLIYDSGATRLMFAERTKETTSAKRERVKGLIYDLNDGQLDIIINLITGLKELNSDVSRDER